MSGALSQPGGETSDQGARITEWDKMVQELNQEHPDIPRGGEGGVSEEFKKESRAYRELGEELAPKLTGSAREAIGVRDGQDLGEMMQERDSWDRQVSERADRIDSEVSSANRMILEYAKNSERNLENGAQTEGAVLAPGDTEGSEAFLRESFLNGAENYISLYHHQREDSPREASGLQALVLLAANEGAPTVNPDGRTADDLIDGAIAKYMNEISSNEEKMRKLQEGPTYKIIQRAVEAWKADQDGRYAPASDEADIRHTRLYRNIDEILSRKNVMRPFGE